MINKDRLGKYVVCFLIGVIVGMISIYLFTWKLGVLSDPRLDILFNKH